MPHTSHTSLSLSSFYINPVFATLYRSIELFKAMYFDAITEKSDVEKIGESSNGVKTVSWIIFALVTWSFLACFFYLGPDKEERLKNDQPLVQKEDKKEEKKE